MPGIVTLLLFLCSQESQAHAEMVEMKSEKRGPRCNQSDSEQGFKSGEVSDIEYSLIKTVHCYFFIQKESRWLPLKVLFPFERVRRIQSLNLSHEDGV